MTATRSDKVRLDVLLVDRGLVASRDRARALILAARVRANDRVITKAGTMVPREADLHLTQPDHPYVGRGGIKLAHALDVFAIGVRDRVALDIGASTGGFTDVLLRRGATRVVALDVGHGQLDWRLRTDARVMAIERINARYVMPADLPAACARIDIVTVDVSFISLRHILPVIPPLLSDEPDVVALVKPQFEAGRPEVGAGGIVRDPEVQARVVAQIVDCAAALGLETVATCESPIAGGDGNREFFVHLRPVRDRASVDVAPSGDAAGRTGT